MSKLLDDPYLKPYIGAIEARRQYLGRTKERLNLNSETYGQFASGHAWFGLHQTETGWVFREWAPNATQMFLVGDFSDWQIQEAYRLKKLDAKGNWEISLGREQLRHGQLYKLHMVWDGGAGDRLPAYARRVVQDEHTKIFNAQVWAPESPYYWQHPTPHFKEAPIIYETHVGMAQDREGIGTYEEFKHSILPRIVKAGYNTIQLMALMEHPYYGSFGYHVANFFAASSRFGTPEELKALIDECHRLGVRVIMDLIHSHSPKNEIEGLSCFDGTYHQYFHEGSKGQHEAWDSRCFDYGKPEVIHFLLSNCRFWLDEYKIDGFRFDGVTSMLYTHHGLSKVFGHYGDYFNDDVDADALTYLTLANEVIHLTNPNAITIAEDVSGMPGLAAPTSDGGCGFDYRMAMGVSDTWFKLVNDTKDEDWNMDWLWQELCNRRAEEKTINYVECHDQALVGGKSLIFELIDADMYYHMNASDNNLIVERGMALHKMARLATIGTAGPGYLNFMGNEFGHPEWVDFPREGNGWSYKYARRQWHLRDNQELKYHYLADFDEAMLGIIRQYNVLDNPHRQLLYSHNDKKLLIYERNGLTFFFNFHPDQSVSDWPFYTQSGSYHLVLSTDDHQFGGQERIQPGQTYIAKAFRKWDPDKKIIRIYLPCRTAIVLRHAG